MRTKRLEDADPVLSSPAETWRQRMCSTLADNSVSQESFDQLARAYEAFVETLDDDEREEIRRRVGLFILTRDAILEVLGLTGA